VNGRTALVFRAPMRDRHGDPVDANGNPVNMLDEEGNAFVGEIKGIVMGGLSASPRMSARGEASDTRGMIGCPLRASVKLKFGDRVEIDGVRYRVISNPEWGYSGTLTGTNFGSYWVDVEGFIG
jgi:hypothetical protein